MRRLAVPAVLAAILMVAGMFGFMPVEKASTVHTTINDARLTILDAQSIPANFDVDQGSILTIASDRDYAVRGIQCNINDGAGGGTNFAPWTVTIGGATHADTADPAAGDQNIDLLNTGAQPSGKAGDDVVLTTPALDAAGAADDEQVDCVVIVQTQAEAQVTATWSGP